MSAIVAIKSAVAHARADFALTGLSGVALEDQAFALALAEYVSLFVPEDPDGFTARRSAWLDIITANGKTPICRQGAFAGLLFQLAEPRPAESGA